MRYKCIPLFLIAVTFFSCKKNIPNPVTNREPVNFGQVFDDYWNGMNANYMFWDIDTLDWNAVYSHYSPIFNKLDLQNKKDVESSVAYFRQIADGLIDHHYYLSFTNALLIDSSVYPAYDHILHDTGYRTPYSYFPLDLKYLDTGYLFGYDNTTDPANPLIVVSGTIHSNILFFSCNQFSLFSSFHSPVSNNAQPALRYLFNRLHNPSGLRGIVIDVRNNLGGDISDLNFLAGQFITTPLQFGYSRYKSGNGRLDYTPWISSVIAPQTGATTITTPITILCDKYSASLAEIFTMAMRLLPNCKTVGETTFGATGPLTDYGIYNDGSFTVPGFMSVKTASGEFKYIDGNIYEGKGFPPDYPVPFSAAGINAGTDVQLEKAISLLP